MRTMTLASALLAMLCISLFAEPPLTQPEVVSPSDLIKGGLSATPLKVKGAIPITLATGEKQTIRMEMPVWARRNSIAVPKDKIQELLSLCTELDQNAQASRDLVVKTEALRKNGSHLWLRSRASNGPRPMSANVMHTPPSTPPVNEGKRTARISETVQLVRAFLVRCGTAVAPNRLIVLVVLMLIALAVGTSSHFVHRTSPKTRSVANVPQTPGVTLPATSSAPAATLDPEALSRSVMPPPPPPPVNAGLEVIEIGKWTPEVVGIVPEGWTVAADPSREMEYSVPGISIRGPIYRVVPVDTSMYFIEPGREGGVGVPAQLATTISALRDSAAVCSGISKSLRELAQRKKDDSQAAKTNSLAK